MKAEEAINFTLQYAPAGEHIVNSKSLQCLSLIVEVNLEKSQSHVRTYVHDTHTYRIYQVYTVLIPRTYSVAFSSSSLVGWFH